MAAPDYVPVPPGRAKYYESPPRRRGPSAARPGELPDGQPDFAGAGRQGPDQGYALKLVGSFEAEVSLAPGEHWHDVAAGAVTLGLKRASFFGRAPIKADLRVALTIWGFFDDDPSAELVTVRRAAFAGLANVHHYSEARRLAAAAPDGALGVTPAEAGRRYVADWSLPLDLDVLAADARSPAH